MLQTEVVEKIRTGFCSIFFFRNLSVYEILWQYMVEPNMLYLTV